LKPPEASPTLGEFFHLECKIDSRLQHVRVPVTLSGVGGSSSRRPDCRFVSLSGRETVLARTPFPENYLRPSWDRAHGRLVTGQIGARAMFMDCDGDHLFFEIRDW